MAAKPYKPAVGEQVSMRPWDRTVPADKRLGVVTVVDLRKYKWSESGYLIDVQLSDGSISKGYDLHWCLPARRQAV